MNADEIGIAHIEDLASPTDGSRTPIAYAQPKLQFTKDIIRPPTYKPQQKNQSDNDDIPTPGRRPAETTSP